MNPTRPNLKRKRATFMTISQDMVEIRVHPYLKPFHFYKDMLCSYSEHFRFLFRGPSGEPNLGYLELLDVSEVTLRIFQQWLYAQSVNSDLEFTTTKAIKEDNTPSNRTKFLGARKELPGLDRRADSATYDKFIGVLLDLYKMADRYETLLLRQDVMSLMHHYDNKFKTYPKLVNVPKAFECLPSKAMFCQYLVNMNATKWEPERDKDDFRGTLYKSLPWDFLMHVMLINTQRANIEDDHSWFLEQVQDICYYHEHKSKQERELCKKRRERDWYIQHDFYQSCMMMAKK